MIPLDLQSERVHATGGIVSEGVLNQLGRPRMDRLTLLVREAGQNSWDAKADDSPTVRFWVALNAISAEQSRILRDVVLRERPPGLSLDGVLATDRTVPLRLLVVSDRGTKGLGGPTRADSLEGADDARDFVDFLRNVGEPPQRIAGGTYGYGKAAFYRASGARTILVHTRCRVGASSESRFMAAALGENRVVRGVRYTGRHWWGRLVDDVVDPVTGDEADQLAIALGLPPFVGPELGTTIVILDPQLDDRGVDDAIAHIAEAILWHFWPKMLPGSGGRAAMEFRASVDGTEVVIPDPRDTPPLHGFAAAIAVAKHRPGPARVVLESSEFPITSQRPAAELGTLGLVRFGHEARRRLSAREGDGAWVIPDLSHHVALMRGPELVVKYVDGPALPGSAVEYAGVFLVDPSVEAAFARSEPPTHDDWTPDNLEDDWEKRYVRIAQRRLSEVLQEYAAPQALGPGEAAGGGLGGFSDELGRIFLGEPGGGLSVPADGRPGGGEGSGGHGGARPRRPILRVLDGGGLEVFEGRRALRVDFSVEFVPGSTRTIVEAAPSVILDGHAIEMDPPVGVAVPEVICWMGPDGRRQAGRRAIVSAASGAGPWSVFITVPADAVVAVEIEPVAGGPG